MQKMKLVFAVVAFAISGLANATVITVSTSGTIDSGQDTIGLFGTPGRNLANLPYVMTVTAEFDSPARNFTNSNGTSAAANEPYVAVVIIDGVRYANYIDHTSWSYLNMLLPSSGQPGITFIASGRDGAGTLVSIQDAISQDIFTDTVTDYLNVPLQGTANITLHIATNKAFVMFKDSDPLTFVMNGDPATLAPPVPPVSDPAPPSGTTPVPEPSSAMLFGAGLLGFAALRRRQSRH